MPPLTSGTTNHTWVSFTSSFLLLETIPAAASRSDADAHFFYVVIVTVRPRKDKHMLWIMDSEANGTGADKVTIHYC